MVYAIVDVVLCVERTTPPHSCKFDIFSHCSRFGIFGDERKSPSELVAKEVRGLRAVASPPMRLVADLLSSGCGGLYAERH